MRDLVASPRFRKAYRKLAKRDVEAGRRIDDVLRVMHQNIFSPSLGTHKLSGKLSGLWACACGYDCRVIFSIQTAEDTGTELILLLDIGTHDEVY